MSRNRYMLSLGAQSAPAGPSGVIEACLPFRWSGASPPALHPVYPVGMTIDQLKTLWDGTKQFNAEVGIQDAVITHTELELAVSRRDMNDSTSEIPNELQLQNPGGDIDDLYTAPALAPTLWLGSDTAPNWNGAGGNLEWEVSLKLCFKQDDLITGLDAEERAYWPGDGSLIYPSIALSGFFNYTTPGTEIAHSFNSWDTSGVEFVANINGIAIPIYLFSDAGGEPVLDFTCDLTITDWFPYEDENGVPAVDAATGVRLLGPGQSPM